MITDGIVNLFVSIQSEGFLREQQNKFHLFDSIFYSLLTGRVIPNRQNQIQLSSAERRYQNVADITAGVSIFE